MPAAIAIPAILGAAGVGASLYGASKAAGASRDAANLQIQATDKAQAFNQQAWQAQQQALSPYRQAGQLALSNLMARQYGGTPGQYSPPGGYGPSMAGALARLGTQNMNAGAVGAMNMPGPQGLSLATLGGPGAMPPSGGAPGIPQPGGGGMSEVGSAPVQNPMAAGPMVTVQAPTGETMQMPQGMAQQAVAKGARIVG